MAYYTRKKGIELWRPAVFKEYDFCICCKAEVEPGEEGLESKKSHKSFDKNSEPVYNRNKLCPACLKEWEEDFTKAIMDLKRFKKQ